MCEGRNALNTVHTYSVAFLRQGARSTLVCCQQQRKLPFLSGEREPLLQLPRTLYFFWPDGFMPAAFGYKTNQRCVYVSDEEEHEHAVCVWPMSGRPPVLGVLRRREREREREREKCWAFLRRSHVWRRRRREESPPLWHFFGANHREKEEEEELTFILLPPPPLILLMKLSLLLLFPPSSLSLCPSLGFLKECVYYKGKERRGLPCRNCVCLRAKKAIRAATPQPTLRTYTRLQNENLIISFPPAANAFLKASTRNQDWTHATKEGKMGG